MKLLIATILALLFTSTNCYTVNASVQETHEEISQMKLILNQCITPNVKVSIITNEEKFDNRNSLYLLIHKQTIYSCNNNVQLESKSRYYFTNNGISSNNREGQSNYNLKIQNHLFPITGIQYKLLVKKIQEIDNYQLVLQKQKNKERLSKEELQDQKKRNLLTKLINK